MKGILVGVGLIVAGGLAGSGLTAQQPDGQRIFGAQCRFCHGADGVPSASARNTYKAIRPFSDSSSVATMSVDSIVAILKNGNGRTMRPYGSRMSPAEIAALAAYVKELAKPKATPPKP